MRDKEKLKEYYKKNRERIILRARESYARNKEKCKIRKRRYFKTAGGIYVYLTHRLTNSNKFDLLKISKDDFINWYNSQEQKCFYCRRTLQEIKLDKTQARKVIRRFSIDRMDNNRGYEKGNMVFACSRCNSIKNNFFTKDEMLKIIKTFPYKFEQ